MSIHVVAVITARPGSEAVVRGALTDLVAPTRDEAGNIAYALNESAATPGVFVTVEEWTDQAALDAHMQTPHIAKTFEVAGEHLAAPPAIHPLVPVA